MSFIFDEMVLNAKYSDRLKEREITGYYKGIDSYQYAVDYIRFYYKQRSEADALKATGSQDPLLLESVSEQMFLFNYKPYLDQTIRQLKSQYEPQLNKDKDSSDLPDQAQSRIEHEKYFLRNPLSCPEYMDEFMGEDLWCEESDEIFVYDDEYFNETGVDGSYVPEVYTQEEFDKAYPCGQQANNVEQTQDQEQIASEDNIELQETDGGTTEYTVQIQESKMQILENDSKQDKFTHLTERTKMEDDNRNQRLKEEIRKIACCQMNGQQKAQFIKDQDHEMHMICVRENASQMFSNFHQLILDKDEEFKEEEVKYAYVLEDSSSGSDSQSDSDSDRRGNVDQEEEASHPLERDNPSEVKEPDIIFQIECQLPEQTESYNISQASKVITDNGRSKIHYGNYVIIQETQEESIALNLPESKRNIPFIPFLWSSRTNSMNKYKRIVQKYYKKRFLKESKYKRELEFTQITYFIFNSCTRKLRTHQIVEKFSATIHHRLDPQLKMQRSRLVGQRRNFYLMEITSLSCLDIRQMKNQVAKLFTSVSRDNHGIDQMLKSIRSYFYKYKVPDDGDLKSFHAQINSFMQKQELGLNLSCSAQEDQIFKLGMILDQFVSLVFYKHKANSHDVVNIKKRK